VSTLEIMSLSDPRWGAFVESAPQATAFHHPAWARILTETYGYRPFLLASVSGQGQIEAGVPLLEVHSRLTGRRAISLPFTDYCPLLTAEPDVLTRLAIGLADLRQRLNGGPVEVHGEMPQLPGVRQMPAGVRHVLELDGDQDEIFSRLDHNQVQRGVKKAEREGVDVRPACSSDDLRLFYDLHCRTRQRLGVPVQPWRFIKGIWTHLISEDLGFIELAYLDSVPVAGGLFLAWNGTVIYKFGASESAYWKVRPNHLILWRAIEWGCSRGYSHFDFGRSDTSNLGLRRFKDGWGTTEMPMHYSRIGGGPLLNESGPARRLLSGVIRRSPAVVCRAMGELLYGHFA
jgi:hypothetical protein